MIHKVRDNTLQMPKFLGREISLLHFHPVFCPPFCRILTHDNHVIKEHALIAIISSSSKGGILKALQSVNSIDLHSLKVILKIGKLNLNSLLI